MMRADAWAALGTWVTAIVAGVAAFFALRQVYEAKKTREKAGEPHVVAYLDVNDRDWQWFDLVVKNFGPSTAYNVTITLPSLKVVPYTTTRGLSVTEVYIPGVIAMLVPGQEWRTIWDSAIDREERKDELKLQTVFCGDVAFSEEATPGAPRHRRTVILDTEMFRNSLRFGDQQRRDPVVEAINQVALTLHQFQSEQTGIWVYAADPEKQRARIVQDEQRMRGKRQSLDEAIAKAQGKRRTKVDDPPSPAPDRLEIKRPYVRRQWQ